MLRAGCAHVAQNCPFGACGGCGKFLYCSEMCANLHWGEGAHHLECIGVKNKRGRRSSSSSSSSEGPPTYRLPSSPVAEEDLDPDEDAREAYLAYLREEGERRRREEEDELEQDRRQKNPEMGYSPLPPLRQKRERPLTYNQLARAIENQDSVLQLRRDRLRFVLKYLEEEGPASIEAREWIIDMPMDEVPGNLLPHLHRVILPDYQMLRPDHPFRELTIYVPPDMPIIPIIQLPPRVATVTFTRKPYHTGGI